MKTDPARQKYVRLMKEIEDIEDAIEKLESKNKQAKATCAKLGALKNELADKKNELARISDGCGTPHAH